MIKRTLKCKPEEKTLIMDNLDHFGFKIIDIKQNEKTVIIEATKEGKRECDSPQIISLENQQCRLCKTNVLLGVIWLIIGIIALAAFFPLMKYLWSYAILCGGIIALGIGLFLLITALLIVPKRMMLLEAINQLVKGLPSYLNKETTPPANVIENTIEEKSEI